MKTKIGAAKEEVFMIYYFTGTGNSEFAAKRIAGKTGMPTVPVYEYISEGKIFEPVQGETLVFVTPTHGWRIPRIVSDWIKAGSFDGAHKAYFVMTCGSEIGDAEKHCKALCDECGFELMGVGVSGGSSHARQPTRYSTLSVSMTLPLAACKTVTVSVTGSLVFCVFVCPSPEKAATPDFIVSARLPETSNTNTGNVNSKRASVAHKIPKIRINFSSLL